MNIETKFGIGDRSDYGVVSDVEIYVSDGEIVIKYWHRNGVEWIPEDEMSMISLACKHTIPEVEVR